jgi:hypothetical protein
MKPALSVVPVASPTDTARYVITATACAGKTEVVLNLTDQQADGVRFAAAALAAQRDLCCQPQLLLARVVDDEAGQ